MVNLNNKKLTYNKHPTPMHTTSQSNHQSFYTEFAQKHYQNHPLPHHPHNQSYSDKINISSMGIQLKRIVQILDQFDDQLVISLQTSIDVLRAVGILELVRNVQDAKNMVENGGVGEVRVRKEIEFLYHLWEMIDEEQIQCRELKEIIQVLLSKNKNQLRQLLPQMYPNPPKCQNFLRSFTILQASQQYNRHTKPPQKSKQNKQNLQQLQLQHILRIQQKLNRSNENLGSPIQKHKQRSYSNKYFNYSHQSTQSNKYGKGVSQKYASTVENVGEYLLGRPGEFVDTLQLNVREEKDLVQRLYRNDIYKTREEMKRQREEQRQVQQLSMCTFKPNLLKRPKSSSRPQTQIRGYEKAIHRLKTGTQKSKQFQHLRDYKPIGQNYQKLKQKGINPPKFLQRKKKEQQKILFIISFDLGRHKTNVKIRESDNQDTVAERICKIYSLKKEFYEEIREIVRKQLDMYYEELGRQGGEGQEGEEGEEVY